MTDRKSILDSLVAFSRCIGEPAEGYVICGEGNTSARIDDHHFFVKISGVAMATADHGDFTEMSTDAVLGIADSGTLCDDEIERRLLLAKTDRASSDRPSIETIMHAIMQRDAGAAFVAHTHPTPLTAILCSKNAQELLSGWLMPEHITLLGPEAPFLPFSEPGLPLAVAVREAIREYQKRHSVPPKSLLLQNHGLIVGGETIAEVEAMTAMWVKAAEILLGTLAAGGPNFLPDTAIERVLSRADVQHHRQKVT